MAKTISTQRAARRSAPTATPADRLHRDLATATIAFHEALARRLGMGAAERKVFSALVELGAATPGQLMESSGFTSGAITGIVDRLERAGFARREDHPHDRRSLLVRPLQVEKVQRAQTPYFASLTAAMARLRSQYSAAELERISAYLAGTIEVLREETRKLGSAGGPGRVRKSRRH